RGGVVYGEDVFNELPEEWHAILLSIDTFLRSPAADNVVELCPFRQHPLALQQEKRPIKFELSPHQESGTLGCQRVAPLVVLRQQLQADERIQCCAQTAQRCLGFSAQLLNGLGASVEHVEYAVPDGGFDNQRRRKAEGELHDAFRRDLRGGRG